MKILRVSIALLMVTMAALTWKYPDERLFQGLLFVIAVLNALFWVERPKKP